MRYEPADRVWFAALARLIPRRRWTEVFPVTPATLPGLAPQTSAKKYSPASTRRKPGRHPESSQSTSCTWARWCSRPNAGAIARCCSARCSFSGGAGATRLLYIDDAGRCQPQVTPLSGAATGSELAFVTGRGPDTVADIEGRDGSQPEGAHNDSIWTVPSRIARSPRPHRTAVI